MLPKRGVLIGTIFRHAGIEQLVYLRKFGLQYTDRDALGQNLPLFCLDGEVRSGIDRHLAIARFQEANDGGSLLAGPDPGFSQRYPRSIPNCLPARR